jgi:hypothetical protein
MAIKNLNIVHTVMNEHGNMFNELIELVIGCLLSTGIDVTHTTNHLFSDRLNVIIGSAIFLPSETLAMIRNLPNGYIIFQLEVLNSEQGHASDYPAYIDLLRGAEQIWDYSLQNVEYLNQIGLTNVRYIPLGYSPRLDRIKDVGTLDIDVLFYGSISPRRSQIIEALSSRGFRTKSLFSMYGSDRDAHIARAKLVLNIHCFETTQLEQVRLSYLLNNKRFVVSETSDSNPYGNGVVFCDYHDIVARCAYYLEPGMEAERMRIAELGYQYLQQIPMANSIANALAELTPR